MIPVFLDGLAVSFGLIVAIGSQNAFVLRQGLRAEHVALVCLTCALSDAALIAAGIAGFGTIMVHAPWLDPVMRYGGAAFLLVYAGRSLASALSAEGALVPVATAPARLAPTLATCLALTWLNPHVYLDTVFLLGSVSTQYPGHGLAFGLGAASASFLFFFALGYGARLLRPMLARPSSWRVLDGAIAAVMAMMAIKLLVEA